MKKIISVFILLFAVAFLPISASATSAGAPTTPTEPTTTYAYVSNDPVTAGDFLIFYAEVQDVMHINTPSGTVTFIDNSTNIGTLPLNGAGKALLMYVPSSAGLHTLEVDYSGDAYFLPSSYSTTYQVLQSGTVVALSSSLNPTDYGQSTTFTAAVASCMYFPYPTGSVTFYSDGMSIGTSTLFFGMATLTTSALPAGNHIITAVYGGDSNYLLATSNALTQIVNQTAQYTVRYTDFLTGKQIAPDTHGGGVPGEKITIKAPNVNGYLLLDTSSKTITLTAGSNILSFQYQSISQTLIAVALGVLVAVLIIIGSIIIFEFSN